MHVWGRSDISGSLFKCRRFHANPDLIMVVVAFALVSMPEGKEIIVSGLDEQIITQEKPTWRDIRGLNRTL